MKTIIVINGLPRAGKDTTINALQAILSDNGIRSSQFSSIDPVRDMLTNAGFDLSAKTDADRRLLSEVGDALEAHSGFRTNACFDVCNDFFAVDDEPAVMFIHMREPAMIASLKGMAECMGYSFVACLVESKRGEMITTNRADAGILGMTYDDRIRNEDSLDDLYNECAAFLFRQGLIDQQPLAAH